MAATLARGCAVMTPPTVPASALAPMWRIRLRRLRHARPYRMSGLAALTAMHDRVVDNVFRQTLCDYDSADYARYGRAILRQEIAFSRLVAALARGAR